MNYNVEKTADDRAKNSGDNVTKRLGELGSNQASVNLCNLCIRGLFFPKHQVFQKRMMRGEARNRKAREAVA